MTRDPRYDILFEPVKIGPVTARNRFYQVPHCNGMGRVYPSTMAAMRRTKAEGGWAVICTEEVEIHPSGDHSPWCGGRLWDDRDIPYLARMCDGIHEFGSLAGCELNHAGQMCNNDYSRMVQLAPSHMPISSIAPKQARAMDKQDIRELRRWHREAALRARKAGFDIVYVYAGHQLSTISHFLSRQRNHRTDEYGGSLENRARLFREILEDTKDAVGDTCGVAVRFAVDDMIGEPGFTAGGEGRDLIEMMAEIPDLWDVNIATWEHDSATSRFKESGFQEDFIRFVKGVTTKPVVGVGRYTSPDAMVSLVKGGVLDFIGAARPSIADPFLPRKVEEGRIEDIRECIGCNICVSGDHSFTPMRCTQNPTKGEEWRKGWHPERIAPKTADESVLIVGAGPAGLEAARALGQRGYAVTLAEAGSQLGGRVTKERQLPGLAEWGRVADYRTYQISQMANVETFLESHVTTEMVRELAPDHVAVATGSHWRRDGVGRTNMNGISIAGSCGVLTPDDIIGGLKPEGPVIIFDDEHYYMAGVIAEKLVQEGVDVTYVTASTEVSTWTHHTLEQHFVQTRMMKAGIKVRTAQNLSAVRAGEADLACIYTDEISTLRGTVLLATMRLPDDALYYELLEAGVENVKVIGDAHAPGTIAAAVYEGHQYARELGEPPTEAVPFERELVSLSENFPI